MSSIHIALNMAQTLSRRCKIFHNHATVTAHKQNVKSL